MRAIVIGGGPVGCFTAIGLARRGHDVVVVDRDPGPTAEGRWRRVGVMQGEAPHAWRGQVVRALQQEMPDVLETLCAAGARLGELPGMPGLVTAMFARRPLVEGILRSAAGAEPRLTWVTGHADALCREPGSGRDRVTGVLVDGAPITADAVIVAAGRASRLGEELRGPMAGGSCGTSYIFRTYRTRPGATAYDAPTPSYVVGPDYGSLVMPADDRTHHLLLVVPSDAPELGVLRRDEGFDRAASAVPHLAPWADPAAHEPITSTRVGSNLTNTYRLQGAALGLPPADGLYFLGDTVCTLNPANGRSLALHVPHAQQLLAAIDRGDESGDISLALDQWADAHIRPWWADHVLTDASLASRFSGEDIDPEAPLASDVICAAAGVEPAYFPIVGPFGGMMVEPDALEPLREPVRELLRGGWRPPTPGPSRAELVAALLPA
ncbi:MAG TPA: FAD-dependent oxidoreductase [Nocardioides sp.]|nr:FAD-dependent oxidoreductase [Nocardioides sp.]